MRYKSCLVEAKEYLFVLYRYIELNPVRAEMVKDPAEYRWSSYQVNGLGKHSDLCTPHQEFLALDSDPKKRQELYRAMFASHLDGPMLAEIRASSNKGMAVGNDMFKDQIERLTGRRLRLKKRGRPLGWRKPAG